MPATLPATTDNSPLGYPAATSCAMVIKHESKPVVTKPANLDVKRMESDAKKVIKRDAAWLKEMAKL